MLLRGIGSAIGATVALFMILPGLGQLIVPDAWSGVLDFLPSVAGEAFASPTVADGALSAGAGAIVFACWVLGSLALAAYRLLRADA